MAEVVVGSALLRVLQDLVGFADLFEADDGVVIAGIGVGMAFLGETPVCRLELLLARAFGDAKDLVVATLGHFRSVPFGLMHVVKLPLSWEIAMICPRGNATTPRAG